MAAHSRQDGRTPRPMEENGRLPPRDRVVKAIDCKLAIAQKGAEICARKNNPGKRFRAGGVKPQTALAETAGGRGGKFPRQRMVGD